MHHGLSNLLQVAIVTVLILSIGSQASSSMDGRDQLATDYVSHSSKIHIKTLLAPPLYCYIYNIYIYLEIGVLRHKIRCREAEELGSIRVARSMKWLDPRHRWFEPIAGNIEKIMKKGTSFVPGLESHR